MRLLLALLLVVAVGFAGLLASTSCVLDARNLEASTDGPGEGGSVFGDGGSDAEAPEADLDCGCCSRAVVPLLPSCSGKVAFEIPAGDCPVPCSGRIAYALCAGDCYAACACDLPADYTLVDAGEAIGDGGGSQDAGASDAIAGEGGGPETGAGARDGGAGS